MNKVYLVSTQKGDWDDYSYEIDSVCRSLEIAKKRKEQIEENIKDSKALYKFLYDSDYDKDLQSQMESDEVIIQFYSYQHKNPQLKIHTINIEEKELL